jgi:PilZ domain
MSQEGASQHRVPRRTERVLIQVPIEIRGNDRNGNPFRETTQTVVINRDGARISSRTALRPESRITVTNLQNQRACLFRVVDRVQKTIGLEPEWGVECLEPGLDFWGILFPNKQASGVAEETVDVLLECTVCRTKELAQLSLESYRGLVTKSLAGRECKKCLDTTDWRLSFIEEEEQGAIGAPAVKERTRLRPAGAERRRAKRLTAKLPLRVRAADGAEEITRTENLSKTGICFYSRREMLTGDRIALAVGEPTPSPGRELRARIVWAREVGGEDLFLYGVLLEENR